MTGEDEKILLQIKRVEVMEPTQQLCLSFSSRRHKRSIFWLRITLRTVSFVPFGWVSSSRCSVSFRAANRSHGPLYEYMWKGYTDGKTDRQGVDPPMFTMRAATLLCEPLLTYQTRTSWPPLALCPDLVPCYYFLFPLLRSKLCGHKHQNLQGLKS